MSTPTRWSADEDTAIRKGLAAGQAPSVIAASLGRPEPSVSRRIEATSRKRITTRPCMCCQNNFQSEGPHNRLCGRCRTKEKTPFDF